jgi:hypothetical protein
MAATPEKRSIDIWLVFVIIMIVITFGGGLFLTSQSTSARFDELSIRTTARLQRLETEMFAARKQLQDIEHVMRKLSEQKPATPAAPEAKK